MYGYYEKGRSDFCLVLEFMAGGSLKELLGRAKRVAKRNSFSAASAKCVDATTSTGSKKHEYNVAQAISWMRQAARGLAYLHNKEVRLQAEMKTSL